MSFWCLFWGALFWLVLFIAYGAYFLWRLADTKTYKAGQEMFWKGDNRFNQDGSLKNEANISKRS